MHRAAARPLVTIITLIAVAALTAGCGGADGPSGYSPTSSVNHASDNVQHTSFIDDVTGKGGVTSGVAHDTSIDNSINAGYSDVPGASMLDDSSMSGYLNYDTGPLDDLSTSSLGFDDPTLTDLSLNDDLSLDSDPLGTSGMSFDAAMTDATDTYGTGGPAGFDDLSDLAVEDPLASDPMLDDVSMDMGYEDPMW